MPLSVEECGGGTARSPARSTGSVTSIFGLLGIVLTGTVLVGAGAKWSAEDQAERSATCRALLRVHECPIFSLAWSPDGRKLAVSGFSPTVKLWDTQSGELSLLEGGPSNPGSSWDGPMTAGD